MKSFREFIEDHNADDGIVLQTLPVAARSFQGDRAGFVTRTIAAVLDIVVVGAVIIGIWIGVWLFLLVFNPLVDYGMPRPGYFVLGGYFVTWAYWTWSWSTSGRSLGQNLMGVRVLDRRDHRPGWQLAALRSAFCVFFPVGIVWIIVSRRNRSVQDVVLRTSVIHDWSMGTVAGSVAPLSEQEQVQSADESDVAQRADHVVDEIERTLHPRSSSSEA